MATSDRLYELTCDCRDLETRLDRLQKDLRRKEEQLGAIRRAAGSLLEELGDAAPAGASDLRRLIA